MDTRETLLNIGLSLFSEKSFEGVGVQEIVQRAGVSKPTLYHYFGNKLGFYQSVLDHFGRDFFELILCHAKYHRDLVKNLNDLTFHLSKAFLKNRELHRIFASSLTLTEKSEHYTITRDFLEHFLKPIEQMFKEAQEDHGNLRGKSVELTHSYLGLLNAVILLVEKMPENMFQDFAYKMAKQFIYGIFA